MLPIPLTEVLAHLKERIASPPLRLTFSGGGIPPQDIVWEQPDVVLADRHVLAAAVALIEGETADAPTTVGG